MNGFQFELAVSFDDSPQLSVLEGCSLCIGLCLEAFVFRLIILCLEAFVFRRINFAQEYPGVLTSYFGPA